MVTRASESRLHWPSFKRSCPPNPAVLQRPELLSVQNIDSKIFSALSMPNTLNLDLNSVLIAR